MTAVLNSGNVATPRRAALVLRLLGFLLVGLFLFVLILFGTPQSRILCVAAAITGFINPMWNIWALALMAPLFLEPAGAVHLPAAMDGLAAGALAGGLRLRYGREQSCWSVWPALAVGVLLIVYASAYPGVVLAYFHDAKVQDGGSFELALRKIFRASESDYYWPLRAALNWTVGLALACVAARNASARNLALFYLFAGSGLLLFHLIATGAPSTIWAVDIAVGLGLFFLYRFGRLPRGIRVSSFALYMILQILLFLLLHHGGIGEEAVAASVVLHEYPFGIGLGTQRLYYSNWFTPFNPFYEGILPSDRIQFLRLSVECGVLLPIILFAALIGIAWTGWSARRSADVMLPLWVLIATVIAFVSYRAVPAQLAGYLIWIGAGFFCGSFVASPQQTLSLVYARRAMIAICGVASAIILAQHVERPIFEEPPRPWDLACGNGHCNWTKWTGNRLAIPIERDAARISFNLYRKGIPGWVKIVWPDGKSERFHMGTEGWLQFQHDLPPTPESGGLPQCSWMTIETDSTYVPAKWEQVDEGRRLGVYVHEFNVWFPGEIADAQAR